MSLSIIIPCFNEEKIIFKTVSELKKKIHFNHEIILIDDLSTDKTWIKMKKCKKKYKNILIFKNSSKGLGNAISLGVRKSLKKYVVIFMSDLSDDINDLQKYYSIITKRKIDAVFGSRFIYGSKVYNYPIVKKILNRIFNNLVRIMFFSKYNDFTNAFKIYDKKIIKKLEPFVSENFNIFLELPLKIIGRGYKYKIIPISWRNRNKGVSKFKLKELGSKYLFTLLYCFFEKILINKK